MTFQNSAPLQIESNIVRNRSFVCIHVFFTPSVLEFSPRYWLVDGGEKLRSYTIPDWDTVFALIDRMPMRQDEMVANPMGCEQSSP